MEGDPHYPIQISNQTQNRKRYVNFENGNIAFEDQEIVNSLIGNNNKKVNAKFITFYKTIGSLGLLISKAQSGAYIAIANDDSSSIKPDIKFPSSKSNCTVLNNWHVISITWSNGKNLSKCWSNGEKLITFTTRNFKDSDHCYIGDLGKISGWNKAHLTGCIGEIIGFHSSLKDNKILHIHEYLMK